MRFLTNNPTLSREQAEELLRSPRDRIALDIETVSLENPLPLGIAIAISPDVGFYFFNPRDELLKEVIEQTPTILMHNCSFDVAVLNKLGIKLQHYDDTMLRAYSAGILEKNLASLSENILDKDNPSVTTLWKKKEQGNIAINHEKLGGLCITHACNTYALWDELPKTQLYQDIDRPSLDLVIEMEGWGVYIDQYALTKVEQETVLVTTDIEDQLHKDLGDVNLASNPQVAKALQDRGIIGTRKTKGGATSVSDESLKPLNHPIANQILDWRSLTKTLSTYVPAFRSVDENGRLHTTFGYTNTGRWSSSKPNLQNITNSDKEFYTIEELSTGLRDSMVAAPGFDLLSLDANQLELRVVAILSQDPLLLEALKSEDLHMATAIQVFGYTDDKDEIARRRYNAKQLNFAILYGADAYKVAEMAECTIIGAQALIDAYFATYKTLKQWIDTNKALAKANGYVTNMFNRIRPIPEIQSNILSIRERGEREAINTIVQGTAVDIFKYMMLFLRGIFPLSHRLILQVHDEMLWEIPEQEVATALEISKELAIVYPDYPCTVKTGKVYSKLRS